MSKRKSSRPASRGRTSPGKVSRKDAKVLQRFVLAASAEAREAIDVSLSGAHTALISRIRGAVVAAIDPQALMQLLWDANEINIDTVVDEFARTHAADGYRDPRIQKEALDALQESLHGALPENASHDFATFANGWYSRYLLAVDVGFEMGFAAANSAGGKERAR
jgi:hypothetical protein